MKANLVQAVLQLLGLCLVVVGLAREAFAVNQTCRPGVMWDADGEDEYVVLNEGGQPACIHGDCGEGSDCHYMQISGAWVYRCTGAVEPTHLCEMRITFSGPAYSCAGGSFTCRHVNVTCVDLCDTAACAAFDSSSAACWDGPGVHQGVAQCPACQ